MKEVFQTLYEISQTLLGLINQSPTVEKVLVKMMDIVIEHTGAERGFIITNRDYEVHHTGHYNGIKVARNIEQKSIDECLSKTLVNKIYSDGKSLLTVDAEIDPRFQGSESIVMGKIRSICAVPIRYSDVIKGIIYIDSSVKRGAFDENTLNFLELFSNISALALINAEKFTKLKKEHDILKSEKLGRLIGTSNSMCVVFDLIKKASATSCPVFIQGESGTGKELIAREIHLHSDRGGGTSGTSFEFVPLYCGGLPETLIESELFGYKKGAFTGANSDKKGLFEVADYGTLFLDEVCDIPIGIQTKLLRVLQEQEIRRIGDTKIIKIDVRVVAATNKEPKVEIKEGRFREDLYYRLNVLEIKAPPLRERHGDIFLLATYFLKKYGKKYKKERLVFSNEALKKIEKFSWRGNVRELENWVQRVVVTANEDYISADMIPEEDSRDTACGAITLDAIEKQIVLERLNNYGGNKTKTAESLGIPLRTFYYKLKEWGIT